jgi:hypothetical protein
LSHFSLEIAWLTRIVHTLNLDGIVGSLLEVMGEFEVLKDFTTQRTLECK